MKKQKQLFINYIPDEQDTLKLSKKFTELLEEVIPNNIIGMLATAKEKSDSLVFYNRFKLHAYERNNYEIVDMVAKRVVYSKIALFISALYIIYYLNKPLFHSAPKDQLIYDLDQEYYRCMENIKFYMKKSKANNKETVELYSIKLSQNKQRLDEIKTLLSKIY